MDLTDSRSVNLSYSKALLEALTSLGLPIPMRASKVLSQISRQERVPIHLQEQLWKAIIDSYPEPLLGIKLGLAMQANHIGLVGHLLMTQKDLQATIDQLISYHPLLGEGGHFEVHSDTFSVSLCYYPNFIKFAQTRVETILAACIAQTQALTGGKFQGCKLLLSYPAPSLALQQQYQELLAIPVQFNAQVSAILFPVKDLAIPLVAADKDVVSCLKPKADALLQTLEKKSFHRKVTLLLQQTPYLTREQVAKHLCLSTRHLGRKLQEEHTSFRTVQDEVRSYYARQWLVQGEMSNSAIAIALGYSDESAFGKAFKRWEGISPSLYNKRQKETLKRL
ncbi:AraC family transcriptional regulator ligand-binding domain-containing protein [Microbulbifer sp. CnH-101-G]|uniref:AraC family transcriptional regulator ligand-binding domain-containing protein n=1 Tax=Microbulbifer sp. CnH-101-G TaxID=3243393 RepID=UPI00403915EE